MLDERNCENFAKFLKNLGVDPEPRAQSSSLACGSSASFSSSERCFELRPPTNRTHIPRSTFLLSELPNILRNNADFRVEYKIFQHYFLKIYKMLYYSAPKMRKCCKILQNFTFFLKSSEFENFAKLDKILLFF